MATSRISTSSIKQGFPKSRSLLAGNAGFDPAATWLIERQTLASATTSITFASIPQTYKHLQVRINGLMSSAGDVMQMRYNADTAANYRYHTLVGNNGNVTAAGVGSAQSQIRVYGVAWGTVTTYPNVAIIDIHDYASSTKYKTNRVFSGEDNNTTNQGEINLNSGLWMSTSAITSLTIFSGVNFNSGSTFALYGMK